MSTASPTAFLLWAILSILFLGFLVFHLWSYDRFQCLRWSAGRQPGAFKRVMTYSYLGSVPLFVVYSIATTVIKYREGFVVMHTPEVRIFPKPVEMYSAHSRRWVLPLNFIFSMAWALELVTHLEELAFWLYMLHQDSEKGEWFESWEYRLWYCGSILAICGMPLTALITRHNLDTIDAYIFLSGSAGSLTTTVAFLYVLWRFPRFIKHVKSEGADPTVVVRLSTFYQLNLARIVFRFMFTVPLLILALDGIIGTTHPLNSNLFASDFLQMIGGIGCFVSSAITLLIFFPRSIIKEAGYKPKPASTLPTSPKSVPPLSPAFSPSPSNIHHHVVSPSSWDGESALLSLPDESTVEVDGFQAYQYPEAGDDGQAPPYAHAGPGPHTYLHQRQPFPHSLSSPQILSPPGSPTPTPVRVTMPPPARYARPAQESGREMTGQGRPEEPVHMQVQHHQMARSVSARPQSMSVLTSVPHHERNFRASLPPPRLHPYVMTFTSPIDLVDLHTPSEDFPRRALG